MLLEIVTNSVLLRGILFAVSFIGLMLLFKRILFIKLELIPVFLISLIICVLNIAGLMGGLKPVAYIIYCSGFIAYPVVFIISLVRKKPRTQLSCLFTDISFWIFMCFTIFLVILLYNMHLSHYDNFSHWALAAKEMLSLDVMPDASSAALMDFTGYPLGSSLFIYYGCRMVGTGEGIMLIMQGVFIVACMLPLLVFNQKLKITIIPAAILIYFVLMTEPKVFNLLVDALLACLGFASLMMILYYRKNIVSAFFVSLPAIVALVLVKNSGLFFAAIDILALSYFAIKSGTLKRNFVFPVLAALLAGAAVWTWNLHCDAVFPDVVGKHSMTSSNFESILAGKTAADIKSIAILMKEKLFNIQDSFIQTMIALNIIGLCVKLWNKLAEEDERKVTKVVLSLDLAFIIYCIGIYAMYIFSMPLDEALYLAGYERYIMTIVLYLVLVFAAYLVYISNTGLHPGKKSNRYAWILLYCFVLVSGFRLANGNYNIFSLWKEYKETNPANAVMVENFETPDASYVMYVPEKYRSQYETGYFNYLMKYKMHTASCYPFLLNDFEEPDDESVIQLIRDYDFFTVYDEDEYIKRFAQAHLDKPDTVMGTYKVQDYPDLRY